MTEITCQTRLDCFYYIVFCMIDVVWDFRRLSSRHFGAAAGTNGALPQQCGSVAAALHQRFSNGGGGSLVLQKGKLKEQRAKEKKKTKRRR